MTTASYEQINTLVIKAREGSDGAISELLQMFAPLIYKTCNRIYIRYNRICPIDDIIKQARVSFIYLTLSQYQPGGQAHYPHFIQKKLHAELVNIYRPIYTFRCKTVPLEDTVKSTNNIIEQIYQDERIEICEELYKYIESNCNQREKDIIYKSVYMHTPRIELTKEYHISKMRMNVIYKRLMGKLREVLSKLGITKCEDI